MELSDPRGCLGRAPPEVVREVLVKAVAAETKYVVRETIEAWCFVGRGGKHCLFQGVWAQGKREEAMRLWIHLCWQGLKAAEQPEGLGVAASRLQVAVDAPLEGPKAIWPVRALEALSFGTKERSGEAAGSRVDVL